MGADKACDDCGADGEELQCICEPVDVVVPANRVGNKPARVPKAALPPSTPKSRQTSAPQTATYLGSKVICCRCKHVHDDGSRLNEWGKPAGKVMAGRRTECPNGCGYHVTIPYDATIHV